MYATHCAERDVLVSTRHNIVGLVVLGAWDLVEHSRYVGQSVSATTAPVVIFGVAGGRITRCSTGVKREGGWRLQQEGALGGVQREGARGTR